MEQLFLGDYVGWSNESILRDIFWAFGIDSTTLAYDQIIVAMRCTDQQPNGDMNMFKYYFLILRFTSNGPFYRQEGYLFDDEASTPLEWDPERIFKAAMIKGMFGPKYGGHAEMIKFRHWVQENIAKMQIRIHMRDRDFTRRVIAKLRHRFNNNVDLKLSDAILELEGDLKK